MEEGGCFWCFRFSMSSLIPSENQSSYGRAERLKETVTKVEPVLAVGVEAAGGPDQRALSVSGI